MDVNNSERPDEGSVLARKQMDCDNVVASHERNTCLEPNKSSDNRKSSDTGRVLISSESCAVQEKGSHSPVTSSTDGELSSDSAPASPKRFYGAVSRDCLEKISDDDSLDLNSEPSSPAEKSDSHANEYSNVKGRFSKELSHVGTTLISGKQSRVLSGKVKHVAQPFHKTRPNSGKLAADILSDDERLDDETGENENSLNMSEANSPKAKHEQSTESVESKLDLSLRAGHDDHGELDYEEDVDDTLDTSRKDEKDGNVDEKEEGEEASEAEDGEHVSDNDNDTDGELNDDDECEEGEIKDTPSTRDEVNETSETGERDDHNEQPLCRFFMRGSCTWGLNCRFFHPGMPNGGFNEGRKQWEMNELGGPEADVLPLPPPPATPAVETAWERGLRQARELRKKSQKRKEMEPDFEEKRKNLSLNASNVISETVVKTVPEDIDFNKENEREAIILDPYYDNMYDDELDKQFGYNTKEPTEGWHGNSNYENFEVQWPREDSCHVPDPYPDFRVSERERVIVGKEKCPTKYRYSEPQSHERFDKRKDITKHVYKKYNKYESYEEISEKNVKRGEPVKDVEVTRIRGEEWIDPWQRARSPIRRKNSSSRSRSRGRRRSRSGSASSSFSSDSFSSRSSVYSSRSTYSHSSSYTSRSSSRSRSPPSRRKPLLGREGQKKTLLTTKSSDTVTRNLVAKAGPVVPNVAINKEPIQRRATPDTPMSGVPAEGRPPAGVPHRPMTSIPRLEDVVTKAAEGPPKPAPVQKVAAKPAVRPGVELAKMAANARPGRGLRTRVRSFSSGSSSSRSRSRSVSSSGSSSHSCSSSASSSSSSSSCESDELYRDMKSPVDSKGSASSSPNKAKRKGQKGQSKDVQDTWKGARDSDKHNSSRLQQEVGVRKQEEKVLMTPILSQTKDPLKLQGQKLNIKLTLKSSKSGDSQASKKRSLESAGDGPPNKKMFSSPLKEAKEGVHTTLMKFDKAPKSSKESSSLEASVSPGSKTQAKVMVMTKSLPVQSSTPPIPVETVAAPKKKSTSSRREELLKQLKAVEDAIARKRTKLN